MHFHMSPDHVCIEFSQYLNSAAYIIAFYSLQTFKLHWGFLYTVYNTFAKACVHNLL